MSLFDSQPELPPPPKRYFWRNARFSFWVLAAVIAAGITYLQSESFRNSLRERIIASVQERVGTRVSLQRFEFSWLSLTAHLEDLVIEGRPEAGKPGIGRQSSPPIFSARSIDASWSLLSLLPLRATFDSMQMVEPRVQIVFYPDGSSNLPKLQTQSTEGSMWADQLVRLRIGQFEILDGEVSWDEQRLPLAFQANNFDLRMKYPEPELNISELTSDERRRYEGTLSFQNARITSGTKIPGELSLATQFNLYPTRIELKDVAIRTAKSNVEGHLFINDLRSLDLDVQADAHLDWQEVGGWLNSAAWQGDINWIGKGKISTANAKFEGQLSVNTRKTGLENWEHVSWELHSPLTVTHERNSDGIAELKAVLSDLQADVLGGKMAGAANVLVRQGITQVSSNLQVQRAGFAEVASALRQLPVDLLRLPWTTEFSGPVNVTFENRPAKVSSGSNIKNLVVRVDMTATPPVKMPPGLLPMSGKFKATFLAPNSRLEDVEASINLPGMHLRADGRMQESESDMQLSLQATQLRTLQPGAELFWDGFGQLPIALDGEIKADAKWNGGWRAASFQGPFELSGFSYDKNYLDSITGILNLHRKALEEGIDSPQQPLLGAARHTRLDLEISSGRVKQGEATAEANLVIAFLDGKFQPSNSFRVEGTIHHLDTATVQRIAGTNFPMRGLINGSFDASGTKQDPRGHAEVAISDGAIYDEPFSKLTAEIQVQPGPSIKINPLKITGAGAVSGSITLRPRQKQFETDITVSGLVLSSLHVLQGVSVALNGVASGHITGDGTFDTPNLQAEFNWKNAGIGSVKDGQLSGTLRADHNQLQWTASGKLFSGAVSANGQAGLAGSYPLSATVNVQNAVLQTLYSLTKGLPEGLEGSVDATATISGNANNSKSLVANGQLTRLEVSRNSVAMHSSEPVRFHYDNQQVRLDSLHLIGDQVDLKASGTIRTVSEPVMNLNATGTLDLAALNGLDPQVSTQGRADLDAQISGTFQRPLWRGRVSVHNASAQFGRLANSLSAISGTIVFDGTRGNLENFRAESGGGEILIGGALRYGEGSGLQFNLNGNIRNVRVRYPDALSTWIDGQVNWIGSTRSSLLEGRIVINRHFIAPPNDLAQVLLGKSKATAQVSTSPFLSNLRLDLSITSAPEVRLDTRTARNLQTSVDAHIQGTGEKPAILGRIGVLSGDIEFAGKRYTINRGEVTFLNPFRFEPQLNLNVQARVQQYDITMDFSGPPDRLNVTYRSDPPLPTRDILSLLVAGGARQTSLRPSSQALPQVTADALLSQALSSQIGSRLDRLFGAGRVRVDPQLNTLGGTASATIAVEQQINNNITLLYATDVSTARQQYVQGEWIINPKLSVVGIRDQNGLLGVNFQITLRFE